jgi:hypothetical protein
MSCGHDPRRRGARDAGRAQRRADTDQMPKWWADEGGQWDPATRTKLVPRRSRQRAHKGGSNDRNSNGGPDRGLKLRRPQCRAGRRRLIRTGCMGSALAERGWEGTAQYAVEYRGWLVGAFGWEAGETGTTYHSVLLFADPRRGDFPAVYAEILRRIDAGRWTRLSNTATGTPPTGAGSMMTMTDVTVGKETRPSPSLEPARACRGPVRPFRCSGSRLNPSPAA